MSTSRLNQLVYEERINDNKGRQESIGVIRERQSFVLNQ